METLNNMLDLVDALRWHLWFIAVVALLYTLTGKRNNEN